MIIGIQTSHLFRPSLSAYHVNRDRRSLDKGDNLTLFMIGMKDLVHSTTHISSYLQIVFPLTRSRARSLRNQNYHSPGYKAYRMACQTTPCWPKFAAWSPLAGGEIHAWSYKGPTWYDGLDLHPFMNGVTTSGNGEEFAETTAP